MGHQFIRPVVDINTGVSQMCYFRQWDDCLDPCCV
jgi:hypothetical protein